MMAATATASGALHNAGPAVAFGDLLDLARCGKDVPEEICDACQTINLGHRRFCKGCGGKLPAFYATAQALAGPPPAVRTRLNIRGRTVAAASGWVGTLLLVVVAAGSLSMMDFPAIDATARVNEPLTAIPPAPVQEVASPRPASGAAEDMTSDPGLATDDEVDENGELDKAPGPRKSSSGVARRFARQAPRAGAGEAAKLARCDTLNFFSRAMCINRECAQPPLMYASSCAEPRRQRRIDEARRNPMQIG
jgi:hypothetical protein